MMAQNLFCIVCYGNMDMCFVNYLLFLLSYLAAAPILPGLGERGG